MKILFIVIGIVFDFLTVIFLSSEVVGIVNIDKFEKWLEVRAEKIKQDNADKLNGIKGVLSLMIEAVVAPCIIRFLFYLSLLHIIGAIVLMVPLFCVFYFYFKLQLIFALLASFFIAEIIKFVCFFTYDAIKYGFKGARNYMFKDFLLPPLIVFLKIYSFVLLSKTVQFLLNNFVELQKRGPKRILGYIGLVFFVLGRVCQIISATI